MAVTQELARSKIGKLIQKYNGMSDTAKGGITESGVVHQFLDPFLRALGWPVDDPERYKYELFIAGGRPDMTLIPESGGTLFVEAKRFGVIGDLKKVKTSLSDIVTPGQMALPGMATDRTAEEQQAINYAFKNGATWAILTNFEKLRLFNARRDWLVLSFEDPRAFLEEFEQLWQLSYESVLNGRLDHLSSQRHREDVDTDYLNFINEWRERLAEDIAGRPTENWWAFGDDGQIQLRKLRAVVQRVLDRLVVVRFAEDHLVIPPGTLYDFFKLRRRNPYTFSLTEFFQKLYRRFDEYHNSALFAPGLADQAIFGDDVLTGLVQKLYEARYRSMSADIMGNTYEQYLGKTLVLRDGHVETSDNLETRKKQGSYYTPQVIVRYLVDNSLGRYLYGTQAGRPDQPDGQPLDGESRKTAADIQDLRLIDPACGSGSFLIYAYEVLAGFYRGEIKRLEGERDQKQQELIEGGMTVPFDLRLELTPWIAEIARLEEYPRIILENHLYGVDLDPQAAEIATVNLIMRAMADQPKNKKRLPLILNQNVKVGNSLIGAGPADERYQNFAAELAEIRQLRLQVAADGGDHGQIVSQIEKQAAEVNQALDENLAGSFENVSSIRPFNWAVEFPEIFLDEEGKHKGDAAGFDVVVGNPPWEIVKPDLREYYAQFDPHIESKLTRKQVEERIAQLNALDPDTAAGWAAQKAKIERSAAYYRQSTDFTRQGRGDRATHKLFVERGYDLLERAGRLSFVIPSGIYTDLGTKPLREMLFNEGRIDYLYNFSNERFFFPHVDHRVKFTLLGAQKGITSDGFWASFRFNPRVAVSPDDMPSFLSKSDNLVYVKYESLAIFSPKSLSVMEFQSQRDYQVAEHIYGSRPLLGEKLETSWNARLNREFDFSNDRGLLNQQGRGIPFYEGKMIHQFDAYWAEPRFWIDMEKVGQLSEDKQSQLRTYRVAHRRITGTTNERTLIASIIPPDSACENNATVLLIEDSSEESIKLFVCTLLNSYVLDYIIRYKIANTINMFYMYQLPVPRPVPGDIFYDQMVPRGLRLTCSVDAFAGLWQKVMGEPWDKSKGTTEPLERQRLRDELDAIVAHLYGLSRADFTHILGTFPLVFPDTDEGRGKKEKLLQVYDEFAGEFG